MPPPKRTQKLWVALRPFVERVASNPDDSSEGPEGVSLGHFGFDLRGIFGAVEGRASASMRDARLFVFVDVLGHQLWPRNKFRRTVRFKA